MNTDKENIMKNISTSLKGEKTAYQICGIIYAVLGILGVFLEIFYFKANINWDSFVISSNLDESVFLGFAGYIVAFIAMAVVNTIMGLNVGKYRRNPELGVKHAGSVRSIVMGAIFNNISLIFAIINFVYAKKLETATEA